MNAPRSLAVTGVWGAALTLVILAMSVLIRLGTRIDGGEAVSVLAPDVETAARIAHRLAAGGVGILAAWALVAGWRAQPLPRATNRAIGAILAFTALLSVIGRYSPGYRIDAVTMANVAGGIALAAAFWWLRAGEAAGEGDPLARVALALLVLLAALGAGVDVAAMRGERALGPLHLWVAGFFAAVALAAAWRQRRRPAGIAVAALCVTQVVLGFVLVGGRPLALAWSHALVAGALALALVQLSARR